MKNNFKKWLKCAGIRVLHTIAQTALATIGTTAKFIGDVDWQMVVSASLLAGVCSILKSITLGIPEVDLPVEEIEK